MTGHVGPRESSLMTQIKPTYEELEARLAELQNRLEQAEQRISALGAPEIERLQQAELNSKAVLDAILEHIPEGITVAAREKQAILVESRYVLDLQSKKPRREQVSLREGLGTRRMYHADGKTPAQIEELPLWRATMKGEIVKDEEWVLLGRHNQPITLMINAGPIRDSSGNVTGGIAAWRDVTDRKQLEIKLRHREEQFTRMFSINPDPISLACVETGTFIDVNRAFLEATGYSREETIGMDTARFWESLNRLEEFRRIIRRDGECCNFEAGYKKKSGEVRQCVLSAKLFVLNDRPTILSVTHDITERKKAEEALRQNEQLLTKVLDALPVGVFIIGKDGRITRVNPAGKKIWGGVNYDIGKEDFDRYKAWWVATGERVTPAEWGAARTLALGETTLNQQLLIEGFDGQKRYILNSAVPLRDPDEGITGAVVVNEDITARHGAEAALRQSEEKYRQLVETATVLIIQTDLEGRVTFLNEYAKEFLGYDDTAIGTHLVDLFNLKDEAERKALIEQVVEVLEQRAHVPYIESESCNNTGEWAWVGWTIRPVSDEEGNVREMLGVGLDVTERKLAEEALRRSEQQFRTLIEAMPTLVWTLKPDGEVEYVNQRWVEYMGMSPDEGPKWMEAVHPEDREQTAESVRRTIEQGESYEIECRLRRHDGVYRWHLSRALPLRDNNGNIFRWFGTSTDIHGHKMIEQDLRRTAAELERSNKELEEFAYVASHDLQEPLRMITGYLKLIERRYKGRLDQDADEFIAYAVDGATRMQQLIADLLAYSRVGTRGHALIPIDLKRPFERAQADLWTTIVETGAKLTHDPLPVVNGDETQLAQLFLNLIGNAIKFRSERTPEIHVGVKAENDSYLFYVRDNGIGFDQRYAPKMFLVFQRLHTRQKYPGTGIGLAICKKIIDRHGGRIWVESEPGKGSTFYFTLPKVGGEPWK